MVGVVVAPTMTARAVLRGASGRVIFPRVRGRSPNRMSPTCLFPRGIDRPFGCSVMFCPPLRSERARGGSACCRRTRTTERAVGHVADVRRAEAPRPPQPRLHHGHRAPARLRDRGGLPRGAVRRPSRWTSPSGRKPLQKSPAVRPPRRRLVVEGVDADAPARGAGKTGRRPGPGLSTSRSTRPSPSTRSPRGPTRPAARSGRRSYGGRPCRTFGGSLSAVSGLQERPAWGHGARRGRWRGLRRGSSVHLI
jgi:hypothetical protein